MPWIVAHPGASKHEIATRFGMTVEQLDDDLALVLMIGVPPYSPGDYLDVDDDGEFVTIRLADQFSRPLRLTPAEGLALLAAGRALLAVPGQRSRGPARHRARRSSRTRSTFPSVVVEVGEPTFLEAVRDAAARGRARRDRLLVGRPRRADDAPHRSRRSCSSRWASGTSSAYCHRAERRAHVPRRSHPRAARDRRALRAAAGDDEIAEVFRPRADDPRVTLELAPSAAWVAEAYPAESTTTRPDGTLEVVLAVSEPAWLERLLVRLGPEARVIGPETARRAGPTPRGGCSRATAKRRFRDRGTDGRPTADAHSQGSVARPAP